MSPLRRVVLVRHEQVRRERHRDAEEDVHLPEAVAAAVLEDLSAPGDVVLDPFAGYGTTLREATRRGRRAIGVELLADRARIAAAVAPQARVITGDARRLRELDLGVAPGDVDLVLTSPPYMTATEHPEDPLAGYTGEGARYATYLEQLRDALAACLDLLGPDGHLVVAVANIAATPTRAFTPLAWDVGRLLAEVGDLVQDTMVVWDRPWLDLAGDYLLVARPRR